MTHAIHYFCGMDNQSGRKIIISEDGSHTMYVPSLDEHYHSTRGAWQESRHIYIGAGLLASSEATKTLNILEVGFGTGLNALQSILYKPKDLQIHYICCEPFPLELKEWQQLNYGAFGEDTEASIEFNALHKTPWDMQDRIIRPDFILQKHAVPLEEMNLPEQYFDLVYFDAFGPQAQPELWTPEIFTDIAKAMRTSARLLTFSSKGSVKRALKTAGFRIEKIPGPPGKREFVRATKL